MEILQSKATVTGLRPVPPRPHWITSLAALANGKQQNAETRMRTTISCDVRSGRQSLYVPPDMADLQPRTLRFLKALARQHKMKLVEDRRRVAVQRMKELRGASSPGVAKALGTLLKQLGMPGSIRLQSSPHRLNADSPHIDIAKLIRMAAHAAPDAKQIKVQPNRHLVDVLGRNNDAINVYACKLMSADSRTILSHFDSPRFRAIGYSAGKQYVMHVCVAGGSIANPSVWADFHTLTRCDFRFQLFSAQNCKDDVGLLYATFYLDVAEAPSPWWLSAWDDLRSPVKEEEVVTLLKRAS